MIIILCKDYDMEWNAKQYLKFENERNMPIFDLIHRIKTSYPLNHHFKIF